MAYVNSQRAAGFNVTDWAGEVLAKWNAARERRAIYLRTLEELSSMSDRDLADIDLSRANIADVAREAAYGK